MVIESSGSSDDDLRPELSQFAVLVHRRSASVAGIAAYSRFQACQDICRLDGELAAGNDDHCLKRIARGVDKLGERQQVSQRLATTRGAQYLHIAGATENRLARGLLHGARRKP